MFAKKYPYLLEDCDRHGNLRRYVRLKGRPMVRLRETPGTLEFETAYHAAVALKPTHAGPAEGSLQALVNAYYAHPIFEAWDKSTQGWRRSHLDLVCKKHGDKPVALLGGAHIMGLRDELRATPGVACIRLRALKSLFGWALEQKLITSNPAAGVKPLVYVKEEHHTWTMEEVAAYEGRFTPDTKARLAVALILNTCGRREDAIRLGAANIQVDAKGEERVRFRQAKNENGSEPVDIDIPLTDDLKAALEACGVTHAKTFLVGEHGKPYTARGFSSWFADRCIEAGVPGRAHGLRKAALTRFAENGATDHELMAWSGHKTLAQVALYTRKANKPRNADNALAKLTAAKSVAPKVAQRVALKGKAAEVRAQ